MTREEAVEILKKNKPTSDPRLCGKELCQACDMAIAALQEPERKHGQWKSIGGFEPWTKGFHCSECLIQTTEDTKYCPNCGAIMDGKEPIKDEQENQKKA